MKIETKFDKGNKVLFISNNYDHSGAFRIVHGEIETIMIQPNGGTVKIDYLVRCGEKDGTLQIEEKWLAGNMKDLLTLVEKGTPHVKHKKQPK